MDREHWELNPRFNLASVSDRGLKHSLNQDFVALEALKDDTYIMVVCDGVSRSHRAELASQLAAQKTCSALADCIAQDQDPLKSMRQAISRAGLAVSSLNIAQPKNLEPPSTTLVAALVQKNKLTLGWLGDSRAYWLSNEGNYLLTKDHSWFNLVVSSGKMTPEQASKHSHAHAITRWLGAKADRSHLSSLKTFTLPSIEGYLLLCSDGLWNYAPKSAHLSHLIFSSGYLDALNISRHLVNFAKSKGGHDNITVSLLSFVDIT